MRMLYILIFFGMILCMNGLEIRVWKTKNSMLRVITYLTLAVNVTVLSRILATFFPVQEAALFMQCIHYAATEWILIALLRFMEKYTKGGFANQKSRLTFCAMTTASNISLLLNCVFHHVATSRYVDLKNGIAYFSYRNLSPGYDIHFYYCCFLAFCNVIALLNRGFHTKSFYRKKYIIPFVTIVLAIISELACNIMDFSVDYSLLVYVILAIFLTHYSVFYTPKGLITETLSYVVRDSHSGIVCFDIDGKCIYANEEAMKIYSNTSNLAEMEVIFRKEIGNTVFSNMEERTWNKVFSIDGRDLHYQIAFLKLYDKKQNYIGCFFSLYDKTEDMERYMKERYRATHDSLTRLYNKEYFFERVLRVLTAQPDSAYYMICTDIKDFKLINDLFGFEYGNDILIHFAEVMKDMLPKETVCGRLESDHFAFCMTKELFSEDLILSCIHQVLKLTNDREYQMHIHAGVYAIQPEDHDVSLMCDRANMAITTVKDDYNCTIAYYNTDHMKSVMREKHLVGEFESALEERQFIMFLQPQVTKDGNVLGAEALVRWHHPEHGMIPPGEFIEVFEKTGLIHRLDQYIWDLAAQKLKEWKERGLTNLHISVNISAKDFYYLDIYKVFTELVKKYDISPENLKLEITETALMMEQDKILVLLEKLQNFGFCVEIDDFGSGYSSLNMLKDIHADVLKIDMGFLRETQNHDRTKIILDVVVDLAKRLQMTVITEGVENKKQVDYLKKAGCDMFQGYYFDRPIPVSEFETKYITTK